MKKRIALTAVVLFVLSTFVPYAGAAGQCGNGNCQRKGQQKQQCDQSGDCENEGSCQQDGEGQQARKGQGQGQQARKGQGQGNGNGYRGGRG